MTERFEFETKMLYLRQVANVWLCLKRYVNDEGRHLYSEPHSSLLDTDWGQDESAEMLLATTEHLFCALRNVPRETNIV